MKSKLLFLFTILLFSLSSQATIVTVTTSGFTFSPSTINIIVGDTINFAIGGSHDVVQTTASGSCTTLSGGFFLPFGGGLLLPSTAIGTVGTYYIKCSPHCSSGMRATINVSSGPGPTPTTFPSVGTAVCQNFSGFNASGFSPSPVAGQLNSNSWSMTDWSTGTLFFGGTMTTAGTDYTRGSTTWGTPVTGGVYSNSANNNLLIQPTSSDMDNGTISYRIQNTSGSTLNTFNVSYDIYTFNDQTRNTDITLAYTNDTNSYWQVPTTIKSTGASPTSTLDSVTRTVTLTGFTVPNNAYLYLRWIIKGSGTGSSDEFAIDNICVTPNTTGTTAPAHLGSVVLNEFVCNNVASSVTSPGGLRSDYIELYNRTSSAIDISGFSLSNLSTNRYLYTIPASTSIAANGYVIIWCDTNLSAPGLHSNFTLNNTNGNIYLNNALGRQIDSVIYSGGIADTSFSRIPNGTGAFRNNARLTPLGVNDTAVTTIIPQVRFSAATSSVNESTSTTTLTINLANPNSNATSVDVVTVVGGTATGGGTDYTYSTTTVTFPASSTTPQTVSVSINNDVIAEADETVFFKLQNATNSARIVADSTHTLTIVDNDQLRVDWDTTSLSYNESAGTVTANVVINTSSTSATSVNVSLIAGTATSGTDFTFTPVTVTFPASSTTPQTVSFTIINDTGVEPTENFQLKLSNPTNSAVINDSIMTVSIIDNDVPSTGNCTNLFFSEYIEGSSNNKSIEIYNPTSSAINLSTYSIVKYINGSTTPSGTLNLSGTIAAGDVHVISNTGSNTAILNQTNDTTAFININGNDALELKQLTTTLDIIGQIGVDPGAGGWSVVGGTTVDKTLLRNKYIYKGNTNWSLASLEWNAYPIDMTDSLGAHRIMPCGTTPPPTISFDTTSMTVNEAVGSVSFGFRVLNPGSTSFSVDVLVDASASTASAGDYTFALRTVNFPAGGTQTLTIINDLIAEGAEIIRVKMRNPTAGAIMVDTVITINIVDNDSLKIGFLGASSSVVETTPNSVIHVKLQGVSTTSVNVDVRYASGDATRGTDFTFTDTTLTFAPGDTQKSVKLQIIDDITDEVNEQVVLTLINATSGLAYDIRNHTFVIIDNDTIGIGIDDQDVVQTKVYPNPCTDIVYIDASYNITDVNISNISGQIVFRQDKIESGTILPIHTATWPAGIYVISIHVDGRVIHKRIIKQ